MFGRDMIQGSVLLLLLFSCGALVLFCTGVVVLRGPPSSSDAVPSPDGMRGNAGGSMDGRTADTVLGRQLKEAGFEHPWATQIFYLVKLLSTLAGGIGGLVLLGWVPWLAGLGRVEGLVLVLTLFLLGFFLPTVVVDKRRASWRRRIEIAVPDAMDFMLVCVEAGQSIDIAAARVGTELEPIHPDLSLRFAELTRELAAGGSRQEAFMHLAQTTDNSDLRQFGTLVVQSSLLGTPMAHSLRVFATDIRDRRIRKVEEKANLLPTKMTLGTMMFTVPPLLILLLTPAAWRLMHSL